MKIFTERTKTGNSYTYTNGVETSNWTIVLDAGHSATIPTNTKHAVNTVYYSAPNVQTLWEYKWSRLAVKILHYALKKLGFNVYILVPGPSGIVPESNSKDAEDLRVRYARTKCIYENLDMCKNKDKFIFLSLHLNGGAGANMTWNAMMPHDGVSNTKRNRSELLGNSIFNSLKDMLTADDILSLYGIDINNLSNVGTTINKKWVSKSNANLKKTINGVINEYDGIFYTVIKDLDVTYNWAGSQLFDYLRYKKLYLTSKTSTNEKALKDYLVNLYFNINSNPNGETAAMIIENHYGKDFASVLTENYFNDTPSHNKFVSECNGFRKIIISHVFGILEYCIKHDNPNSNNVTYKNLHCEITTSLEEKFSEYVTKKLFSKSYGTNCLRWFSFPHWSEMKPSLFFKTYINATENYSFGTYNFCAQNKVNASKYTPKSFFQSFYKNIKDTQSLPNDLNKLNSDTYLNIMDAIWEVYIYKCVFSEGFVKANGNSDEYSSSKDILNKYLPYISNIKDIKGRYAAAIGTWGKKALIEIYSNNDRLNEVSNQIANKNSIIAENDDRYIMLINSMSNFYKLTNIPEELKDYIYKDITHTFIITSNGDNALREFLGDKQDEYFSFAKEDIEPNQILHDSGALSPTKV